MTAANQTAVAAGMAECRPAVVSAGQGPEGAAGEEAVVVPVEVSGGQQEEALGTAVGGVTHWWTVASPGSGQGGGDRGGGRKGSKGRAQRKRKYPQWRQDIEPEFERLDRVVRQVLVGAPADSRVRKLARYELKALERMREEEANVATRDEADGGAAAGDVKECA